MIPRTGSLEPPHSRELEKTMTNHGLSSYVRTRFAARGCLLQGALLTSRSPLEFVCKLA